MGLSNFLLTGYWNEPANERAEEPAHDSSTALNIPSRAIADRAVGIGDALSLSSVYRANQIIVTSVVQLSLDAYRSGEKMEPQPLLIRRPNMDDTREGFLEETVASMVLNGNAYWRIYRDSQGRITNLEVLNPLDVIPQTNANGKVTGYRYGGRDTPIPVNEIQHLRVLRVPGSATGLGPIQTAQRELRGALDLNGYANNWFQDSGVPSGVLTTDQAITAEQAEEARQRWADGGAGGVKVLGEGLDYKSFYLSAQELQFIENQRFSVTQVARLFGVPASLMLASVEGGAQTYQNVEQEWIAYTRYTLTTYTREIETAFSSLLGRSTSTYARFNFESLLRPDTKTRYEAHSLAVSAGWMTPNEVRKIEGYAPLPDGDALLTPSQPTQEGSTDA